MHRLKALFLDRDGTIIEMVADPDHGLIDSAYRPEDVNLMPGAAALISSANERGLRVACITNQPGVARGRSSWRQVQAVNSEMLRQLAEAGASIDHIGVCPHDPHGSVTEFSLNCECRKPQPALLTHAMESLGLCKEDVLYVGDGFTDVQAGSAAGVKTVLLSNLKSYHMEYLEHARTWPTYVMRTLLQVKELVERQAPTPLGETDGHQQGELVTGLALDQFGARYLRAASEIAMLIDPEEVEAVVSDLRQTRDTGGRLFVAGNGGGAAHASHFAADMRKLAGFEAYCVSDNVSELTARVNDDGWESSYAAWLRGSRLASRDLLFIFSVGGGEKSAALSQNLVSAVDVATDVGARTSGFVGPGGGYVAERASSIVRIPVADEVSITAHTEGFQAVLAHLMIAHPDLATGTPTWEQRQGAGHHGSS